MAIIERYRCDSSEFTRCVGYHNGFCHSIENCSCKHDLQSDLQNRITDLLYEFNVRGDIKIEGLAELIMSELNNS